MELRKTFQFEAAHLLPLLPETHKCRRLHGHSFQVEIVVAGECDPKLGWVVDFAEVDAAVGPLMKQLDHRYLNDVPGLENPTSEVLARWIWERLAPTLGAVSQGLALTPGERSAREIAREAGVAVQARFRGQQIHRNDRLLLACDADLVNAEELARAVGHSDPTQTAVLLASLYERDGERFVERLRGAFSLVIWDAAARQMMRSAARYSAAISSMNGMTLAATPALR